jgi:hypothetical protein
MSWVVSSEKENYRFWMGAADSGKITRLILCIQPGN